MYSRSWSRKGGSLQRPIVNVDSILGYINYKRCVTKIYYDKDELNSSLS